MGRSMEGSDRFDLFDECPVLSSTSGQLPILLGTFVQEKQLTSLNTLVGVFARPMENFWSILAEASYAQDENSLRLWVNRGHICLLIIWLKTEHRPLHLRSAVLKWLPLAAYRKCRIIGFPEVTQLTIAVIPLRRDVYQASIDSWNDGAGTESPN